MSGDSALLDRLSVAVVGTREPSGAAARSVAAAVAAAADMSVPVAAGLAAGVDRLVQLHAQRAGVALVAFAPVAVTRLPDEYLRHARLVLDAGGAVLTPADATWELGRDCVERRNEVLVASCAVLVVAEARARSMSMHAAGCAVASGRPLVVPEPSVRTRSMSSTSGCRLLAQQRPTTAAALGWPEALADYVAARTPVADLVSSDPGVLRAGIADAYRATVGRSSSAL